MIASAKLSVPYSDACRLSEKQKIRLIKLQARRISVQEWEVNSLIDICKRRGWIDKGLALLYEYAGCIDDFRAVSELRGNAMESLITSVHELVNEDAAQCTAKLASRSIFEVDDLDHKSSSGRETSARSIDAVSLTNKLISVLCTWRKLQWSPRPVLFVRAGTKVSFQTVLRDEASALYAGMIADGIKASLFDIIPIEHMAVLLSPALDFREFLDLYQHLAERVDLIRPSSPVVERYDVKSLLQPDSPLQLLYRAVSDLCALEDRIEITWNSLHAVLSKSGTNVKQIDPFKLFPTLRLPYRNFKPPTEDLDWFREALPNYDILKSTIQEVVGCSQFSSAVDDTGESGANSENPHSSQSSPAANGWKSTLLLEGTAPIILSPVSVQEHEGPECYSTEILNNPKTEADTPLRNTFGVEEIDVLTGNITDVIVGAAGPALLRSSSNQLSSKEIIPPQSNSNKSSPRERNRSQKYMSRSRSQDSYIAPNHAHEQKSLAVMPSIQGEENALSHQESIDQDNELISIQDCGSRSIQTVQDAEVHNRTFICEEVGSPTFSHTSSEANEGPLKQPSTTVPHIKEDLRLGNHPHKSSGSVGLADSKHTTPQHAVKCRSADDDYQSSRTNRSLILSGKLKRSPRDSDITLPSNNSISVPSIHRAASADEQLNAFRRSEESDDIRSRDSILRSVEGDIYQTSPLLNMKKGSFANDPTKLSRNCGKTDGRGDGVSMRVWSAPATDPATSNHRKSIVVTPLRFRKDVDEKISEGLETLSMLDILSRPFYRGPVMAESQVVHFALQHLHVDDDALEKLAARKISIWWRIVGPRKMLLRRLAVKSFITPIVLEMTDAAVIAGETRRRRRKRLLRNGAAIKIQRYYRFWSETVLAEERRIEREERSRAALESLELWSRCVLASVRIFRYIRWARRKKIIKRNKKDGNQLTLAKTIYGYIQMFALSKKLERQMQLYQSMSTKDPAGLVNSKRAKVYKERTEAAVTVQKYYRRLHARNTVKKRRYFNAMSNKITYFFISCIAKRRVREKKILNSAITRIQTYFRGVKARQQVLQIVSSGLRLNAMWRRHVAYKSLKSQLRRVDRPHSIIVRGVRNISKKTVNSDTMSFKVSVWWHPLLHIVSQNDFNVIIQSKQPQFIYKSSSYFIDEEGDARGGRRLSISQSLRKLSTMMLSQQNDRQKTYQEYVEAQQQRALSMMDNTPGGAQWTPRQSLGRPKGYRTKSGKLGSANKLTLPPLGAYTDRRLDGTHDLLGGRLIEESEDDEDSDDGEQIQRSTGSGRRRKRKDKKSLSRSLYNRQTSTAQPVTPLRPGTLLEEEEDELHQSSHELPSEMINRPTAQTGNTVGEWSFASSSNSHTFSHVQSKDSVVQNVLSLVPPHAELYQKKTAQQSFRSRLSTIASVSSARPAPNQHRYYVSCEDDVVKIPGCHGNSVIKFDIFEGDRKYGTCFYYLSKGGEMMYWGGEYSLPVGLLQQRRAVQLNSHLINFSSPAENVRKGNNPNVSATGDEPVLDFRIIAGAPMRSKCSWGRMIVRGNGPLKRALQGRDIISAFLFDKWRRFYFSLDEFGLFMYDNKFNTEAFYCIHAKDLRRVSAELGAPIHEAAIGSKAIVEDLYNVKVTTYSGDVLFMRFQDSGTRVSWHEVLSNAIAYQKTLRPSRGTSVKNRAWLRQSMAPKKRDSPLVGSSKSSGVEEDLVSGDSQVL